MEKPTEEMKDSCMLKLVVAFFLGLASFPLMFLLGLGVLIPESVPGAVAINVGIFAGSMAGYFLLVQFLLSLGNPRAVHEAWPTVLAISLTPLLTTLLTLVAERRKGPVLLMAGVASLAVTCSYAGAWLAGEFTGGNFTKAVQGK